MLSLLGRSSAVQTSRAGLLPPPARRCMSSYDKRSGPSACGSAPLSTATAAEERGAVAAIEELGYRALWFRRGASTKEVFAHAGVVLGDTERIVVATGIGGHLLA